MEHDGNNYLIVTLDSCRWDSYQAADTEILDRYCTPRLAYAQATFTYPAHMAIYRGYTPCTHDGSPLFDRRAKPLFRIAAPRQRQHRRDGQVVFAEGTPSIMQGFASMGYRTFGVGAMGWFEDPDLTSPFQDFEFTGIHSEGQAEILQRWIDSAEAPFFALWNVGETHEPYDHGGPITPRRVLQSADRPKAETLRARQAAACTFAVEQIANLIEALAGAPRRTTVLVTADHGECFGEDDLWGHAIYHPMIMHVPLLIFTV